MSVSHSFENLDQPTLVFLSAAFAQLEVDSWLEKTEGRQKSLSTPLAIKFIDKNVSVLRPSSSYLARQSGRLQGC